MFYFVQWYKQILHIYLIINTHLRHPRLLICPFSFITIHPLPDMEVFDTACWVFQTYNLIVNVLPFLHFSGFWVLFLWSFAMLVAPINHNVLVVTCLSLHMCLRLRWYTFLVKILFKSLKHSLHSSKYDTMCNMNRYNLIKFRII